MPKEPAQPKETARQRSARVAQVIPHVYREKSKERRRCNSVPTKPNDGGVAAEAPIQIGTPAAEEGFTVLNKPDEKLQSAAANILIEHPEFNDLLGMFQTQGLIPAEGYYDGEGNPMDWDCGPLDWNGLCDEEDEERQKRSATVSHIIETLPPLGSDHGRHPANAQDSTRIPEVDATARAEAGGAQLLGNTIPNHQEYAQMGNLETEGTQNKDGPEMDEETTCPTHLAAQAHEGGMGEAGAFPGHAGGHDREREPGSGTPGPHDLPVEVSTTADQPKVSKAANRKRRAKAIKCARNAYLPLPDTHFQLHGRGLPGTKRKYRDDSPYPRGNRRRAEHPKPQEKKGYYTEEYQRRT